MQLPDHFVNHTAGEFSSTLCYEKLS